MVRRAITVMVLAAVVSVFGLVPSFAEETPGDNRPRGYFGIGAGMGIRYGFGGIGIEVSPAQYVSVTAGAGFLGVAGYSVGLQVFPLGRVSKVRPWLSVSAGDALASTGFGVAEMSFIAYGIGGEVGFGPKHSVEFGIDVANGDSDTFVYPTIGWKYHF
ncbi:MAG: hypothetical protein A2075_02185 [Geobacteraceae bacterium GWC2_58_44]|nr:MAG: hypothetical protein A2075_02185 [Geobacteraceae bacterium GWC2_58_44]HBG05842.1 hypothetical protein [Geobacter sp.]